MFIRPAHPNDAAAIAALRERTIRTVVAAAGVYTPDEIARWSASYTAERVEGLIAAGNFLVAELGGRVVGMGRLKLGDPLPPGQACLRGLFTDADTIGRGAGTALVRALLARAARQGVTEIALAATLNAETFYDRLGFTSHGRERFATINGTWIAAVDMRRAVTVVDAVDDGDAAAPPNARHAPGAH
ncbi:hypothetical protein BH11PLA1_BH11PLA1_23370 [soil metagenome]